MTATAEAPAVVDLDIAVGRRAPKRCGICHTPQPAVDRDDLYELEVESDHSPVCATCSRRVHPPLAAAVALLNAIARARRAGRHDQAHDAVSTFLAGLEMTSDDSAQPVAQAQQRDRRARHNRRSRRR